MNKKRRLALVCIAAAAFAIIFYVGSEVEMTTEDAEKLKDEFAEQVKNIDTLGIFLNNIRIALAMFIPGFGIAVGIFSAFSTGMVFNALVQTSPQISNIPPLLVFATPFGVMELFSYGMAMSQSGILVNALVRKQSLRPFLKPVVIELGIVAGVLLAGAFIEFYMIETFNSELPIVEKI